MHLFPRMIVLSALTLGMPAGSLAGQARPNYEELQTFSAVLNYIRISYVDSVPYARLVRAAVDGVLRSLDPHSRFQPREEVERAAAIARGDLGTVGMELEDVDGAPIVLTVAEDGPADRKGVMPGDRLVSVDDSSVAGHDAETLMLRMAGKPGSRVRLGFERGARLEPRRYEVSVKRDYVEVSSVGTVQMVDTVTGFAELVGFGVTAAEELEKAVTQLRRSGAQQLILDLRGNPGGTVTQSVDIAALFLPKATVVFRKSGRKRPMDTTYVTLRDGRFADLPLVVLIDEGSASAAEALAGSLQDHDRALVVGTRSFGKALVQIPFVLPGGDVVWLTVGRVVTPSGRFIQRHYAGLAVEQYYELAGTGGTAHDTAAIFTTDAGREVRGGGGIRPDIEMPARPPMPAWHAVAADRGFEEAVADSMAYTLSASAAGRAAWRSAQDRWERDLLPPFFECVRERLGVSAPAGTGIGPALARRLAARVALVRWGRAARDELLLASDPVVLRARTLFGSLSELLAGPPK